MWVLCLPRKSFSHSSRQSDLELWPLPRGAGIRSMYNQLCGNVVLGTEPRALCMHSAHRAMVPSPVQLHYLFATWGSPQSRDIKGNILEISNSIYFVTIVFVIPRSMVAVYSEFGVLIYTRCVCVCPSMLMCRSVHNCTDD